MDVLTDGEIDNIVSKSKLAAKYNKVIDTESAYEILTAKLKEAAENLPENEKAIKAAKPEPSTFEKVVNSSVTKSIMRTAGNTIVRSLLGSLGMGGRTTRRKSTGWF
jgi:ubiquitin-protein ligase